MSTRSRRGRGRYEGPHGGVEGLLRLGCDPNAPNRAAPPHARRPRAAAWWGLLQHGGADLDTVSNSCGLTVLMLAAQSGQVAVAAQLVEAGADATLRATGGHSGKTAPEIGGEAPLRARRQGRGPRRGGGAAAAARGGAGAGAGAGAEPQPEPGRSRSRSRAGVGAARRCDGGHAAAGARHSCAGGERGRPRHAAASMNPPRTATSRSPSPSRPSRPHILDGHDQRPCDAWRPIIEAILPGGLAAALPAEAGCGRGWPWPACRARAC